MRATKSTLTPLLRNVATIIIGLVLFLATAQAQTYKKLHDFTGGSDGAAPDALTIDKAGNLYGTAAYGGAGYGTVFKLADKKGTWVFSPLYSFAGGEDGAVPSNITIGPNSTLFGTTQFGGDYNNCIPYQSYVGCGTAYNLKPSPNRPTSVLSPWDETVLYRFTGGLDGGTPYLAQLVFDPAGNIYGTTWIGGQYGDCVPSHGGFRCGTVYKLTPSGKTWTESVLWDFGQSGDGVQPVSGVIFDKAGNLYGTTSGGGQDGYGSLCYSGQYGYANVYELTPSGSSWNEKILHTFSYANDDSVYAGVIFDQAGNLYGASCNAGAHGGGFVYELMPSGGSWTYSDLYDFSGRAGGGPFGNLAMDSAGNLYGTTFADGLYGYGSVFKLVNSSGIWTYTSLHDFTGGEDGANPVTGPIFDANGNLYGTAEAGGANGKGVVFEITP